MAEIAKWYVIHTYSGYEKKVETNIQKMVENRGLHEQIVDIRVPEEVEINSETKKEIKHKIFPGYVFVKMIMSDDAWHAIRNIRGVTGFVGPESKPVPLTDTEIETMKIESSPIVIDFELGDMATKSSIIRFALLLSLIVLFAIVLVIVGSALLKFTAIQIVLASVSAFFTAFTWSGIFWAYFKGFSKTKKYKQTQAE